MIKTAQRPTMLTRLTWSISLTIVLAFSMTSESVAAPSASDAVFDEVMKACKHTNVSEAMIFVAVPGTMGQLPSAQAEENYLKSDESFRAATAGNSKCWTRDRWTRYVKATLKEQRDMAAGRNSQPK